MLLTNPTLVDNSAPQDPAKTNDVVEPEPPVDAWDIVPSPLDQPGKDDCTEMKSADDETENEQKREEDSKHVDAAGWAFT